MNKLQKFIYNEGERLVPYVSHNNEELVRHRSSYSFFKDVIMNDQAIHNSDNHVVRIVDLGSGTGYGCALLSSIEHSKVLGVDIEPQCAVFAEQYYPRLNVDYHIEDLASYIPKMETFDYALSRGVLEHVPGGVKLVEKIKSSKRTMIDVPYNETPGNEHHVITGILEKDFDGLADKEIFYEDIEGNIYREDQKPLNANLIMVVISDPNLPKVSEMFEFPISKVVTDNIEKDSLINFGGKRIELPRDEFLNVVEKAIRETEVVADIGCGIVPMNYFRPKLHFMVEPWKEYSDILAYRHALDKSVIILKNDALSALRAFGDKSVDSVFLLDVIEHIEKEVGKEIISECERVAREQIVIFTPLGFMEQHMEQGEKDGWGLSGESVQEHLSGWHPDEFDKNWSIYTCDNFHKIDCKGSELNREHGAFFAIRNFDGYDVKKPNKMSEIRRILPSEREAAELREDVAKLKLIEAKYKLLLNSRPVRFINRLKAVIGRP